MSQNFNPTYHEFARGVLRAPKMGDGRWEMGGGCGWRVAGDSSRATSNPIRRTALGLMLCLLGALVAPVQADIRVTISTNVNAAIPDRGQYVSTFTIANSGIQTINSVGLNLNLSTGGLSQQLYSSLTHGSASETERFVQVFSNPVSIASSYTFGNQFDGPWLESNLWSLLVADQIKGGPTAQLNSWGLTIEGEAKTSGTMDPGRSGEVAMAGSGSRGIGAKVNSTGTGAEAVALKATDGQTMVLSNGISGQGFRKTGAGDLRLQGNSADFNGRLDVEGGKIYVDGTLGSGSTVSVGSGGKLGGTGTIGALEIASGGVLAVGNSPGQLNAGNTTWAGGAEYDWEIDDFTGNDSDFLAGRGTNWDFLNITGTLNVTAGPSSKFIIDVLSLLANDNTTGGNADNWDPLKGYSFSIATASGGIQIGGASYGSFGSQSAFDTALNGLFNIRTTGFSNAPTSSALWNITTSSGGQTLLLNYNGGATAIPEPNSASLVLLGLGIAYLRRRRRG